MAYTFFFLSLTKLRYSYHYIDHIIAVLSSKNLTMVAEYTIKTALNIYIYRPEIISKTCS